MSYLGHLLYCSNTLFLIAKVIGNQIQYVCWCTVWFVFEFLDGKNKTLNSFIICCPSLCPYFGLLPFHIKEYTLVLYRYRSWKITNHTWPQKHMMDFSWPILYSTIKWSHECISLIFPGFVISFYNCDGLSLIVLWLSLELKWVNYLLIKFYLLLLGRCFHLSTNLMGLTVLQLSYN